MRKTITPGQISQTNMQLLYQYIYRNGPVSQQDATATHPRAERVHDHGVLLGAGCVRLARHRPPPVARRLEPVALVDEEDVGEDDAADGGVLACGTGLRTVLVNRLAELTVRRDAVLRLERLPRPVERQRRGAHEEAAASDASATCGLELEEEQVPPRPAP